MSADAERLLGELLRLPTSDRVEVFERLGAHLDAEQRAPLSESWRAEIARRIARLDEGQTEPLDVDELERELWAEQQADERSAKRRRDVALRSSPECVGCSFAIAFRTPSSTCCEVPPPVIIAVMHQHREPGYWQDLLGES